MLRSPAALYLIGFSSFPLQYRQFLKLFFFFFDLFFSPNTFFFSNSFSFEILQLPGIFMWVTCIFSSDFSYPFVVLWPKLCFWLSHYISLNLTIYKPDLIYLFALNLLSLFCFLFLLMKKLFFHLHLKPQRHLCYICYQILSVCLHNLSDVDVIKSP